MAWMRHLILGLATAVLLQGCQPNNLSVQSGDRPTVPQDIVVQFEAQQLTLPREQEEKFAEVLALKNQHKLILQIAATPGTNAIQSMRLAFKRGEEYRARLLAQNPSLSIQVQYKPKAPINTMEVVTSKVRHAN